VTFRPAFEALNGRLASKALDDRLGCFILLQLAHRLQAHPAQCEVLLAFVTQEETRLQGAVPVASHLRPDWALGLDATLSFDTPDLPNGQTEVRLGGGPAIKIMDHLRGMGLGFVPHLGLRRHIEAVAAAVDIPLQREVVIGLSTAAAPLPFLGAGLPVAAVSFPLRYSHSPVEVADAGDADATLQLLEAVVRSPWKD
jgi:putative aminopeptidase FrvX